MKIAYKTYRAQLRERFNFPIFKITVHGGFSCPHREQGGCHFCDTRAFSPAANKSDLDPVGQLQRAIERNKGNYEYFIAYLQPNTNTYGSVDELRAVYEPLIEQPGVVGLAVGTRPDVLSDDVLDYLQELAGRTYLSVELGLQSSCDDTLKKINRGHNYRSFVDAVDALSRRGIEVIVHLMVGLPGESSDRVVKTVRDISSLPVSGVKFHQLMILEGTEFADWYRRGEISPLTLDQYSVTLGEAIANLRPDIAIHRLMADTPAHNRDLLAPLWSADKKGSQRVLQEYLISMDIKQGERW